LYFTENVSPEESIVPARAAVSRALELDAQFAPAHEAAALIHMIDWDFAGAEREYRRSLRLDPSQVRVHHGYAQLVLNPAGRYQEGVDQLRQAMELDPVSINLITELGVTYRHLGNFGSARELLDKSLNLNRGALGTRTELVLLDVIPGRYAEAVRSMEAINADGQGDPWIMGHMGYIYARAGRSADARRILAALKATSTADMHIAAVHAGLGEANSALDWLERGVATRSPSMLWVKSDFRFAGLHSNPRYAALAAHLP
jgi:serine/threonine-protein kinase